MSKFTAAITQKPKQIAELQQTAAPDLPTGTPAPAPATTKTTAGQSSLLAALTSKQPAPQALPEEIQQPIQEGADSALAVEQEAARHTIPGLPERAADTTKVERWLRPVSSVSSQNPDGGMRNRAVGMAKAVQEGKLYPSAKFKAGSESWKLAKEGDQRAAADAADAEGSLSAALNRSGAMETMPDGRVVPSTLYTQVASAVTENMMAELSLGEGETVVDPISRALGEDSDTRPKPKTKADEAQPKVSKAQGNARLGQMIHQEFQRTQGNKVPDKLPQKEAETLGDAYKELWAENAGTDIVDRIDGTDGQVYFQLTAKGADDLKAGAVERKRLFPKPQARPTKTPIPTGQLPGDIGENVVKTETGKVGSPKFGGVINEAKRNLAQVPNVVDKQRAKILFSTVLPVLASGDHSTWMAEINNFGPSKLKKYAAAKRDQELRFKNNPDLEEEIYDPEQVMGDLTDKIAQEVRAIAQERKGANYLTYTTQAFNGRISPNQTFFDPTSSKAVRFVTRNAVPARATPGSRIDKNLRQMYAMMLVGDTHKLPALRDENNKFIKADALLPAQRDLALNAAAPQLEKWGDRLAEALTMTDEQYEQISQAIESGAPLDQNFPQVPQLELDPEADAELIQAIQKKGEDGPHFIDGLIDFAKYNKARKKGQPYHSYFNAYIDGKTNGIASNGIQMGHLGTAQATGVIRKNVRQLLDEGDIRDQLKNLAVSSISQGWEGNTDGFESELNDVAENLFSYRDFNKQTTMTFGYGKEINSFKKDIEEYLGLLDELAPEGNSYKSSLKVLDEKMSRDELAGTLLEKYSEALTAALSDAAIDNRGLMRGAAILHSATNKLFSIKSYTGMDINLGRNVHGGRENATSTGYRIYGEGKPIQVDAFHYETEATSAAVRNLHGDDIPGEYAYGGSLPGPVQSLDAATVAMTAAGKSWQKLKDKSMGNPYMHTIYDAFKMDAMGYDTVLEEVNKNWLKASMDWSYLDETLKSTTNSMKEWNESVKGKPNSTPLTSNERIYMDWMLKPITTSSGKQLPMNYVNKMSKVVEDGEFKTALDSAFPLIDKMKEVGYDYKNPPAEPNLGQLKVFVKHLVDSINLRPRLTKAVNDTNKDKALLRRDIQRRGYKTPSGETIALQYYAH